MMGRKSRALWASIITGVLFAQFGCKNENTTDPPAKTKLAPVTDVKAYSVNETSVALAWSHSSSQTNTDMTGYSVITYASSGVQQGPAISVSKDSVRTVVTGLPLGIFTFAIKTIASASSSNYQNSDSAIIKWSPAYRFNTEGGLEIKVYETTSSALFPSGLIFAVAPDTLQPKTVSVSNPGSYATKIDLVVRSSGASNVEILSANVFNPAWKATRFSTTPPREVLSLDDPAAVPPDTGTYTLSSILVDSSTAVGASRLYYFKTDNANYGRLLLKRNAARGNLVWGSSPDQYINVVISYQSQARNPYSKPWRFSDKKGAQ
jgi:hypothetical protein